MNPKPLTATLLKLTLQVALAVLALMGIWYGVSGMLVGASPYFGGTPPPALDNQARYMSGMYLLFPIVLLWIIPSIERHALPIRIVTGAMMCGGVGRLISLMQFGSGSDGQLISMAAEIGAPILILWQHQVALRLAEPTQGRPPAGTAA